MKIDMIGERGSRDWESERESHSTHFPFVIIIVIHYFFLLFVLRVFFERSFHRVIGWLNDDMACCRTIGCPMPIRTQTHIAQAHTTPALKLYFVFAMMIVCDVPAIREKKCVSLPTTNTANIFCMAGAEPISLNDSTIFSFFSHFALFLFFFLRFLSLHRHDILVYTLIHCAMCGYCTTTRRRPRGSQASRCVVHGHRVHNINKSLSKTYYIIFVYASNSHTAPKQFRSATNCSKQQYTKEENAYNKLLCA